MALFLFSSLQLSLEARGPAHAAAASSPKAAMIATAADLSAAGPLLARIWPGYWPARQPFIVYLATEGALLVSDGDRPDGFEALAGPDATRRLRGRAFWHGGRLDDVQRPFVTDYPIGAARTAILANAQVPDEDRIIATLLHEQFHVFQKTAFQRPAFSEFVDPAAIPDRLAFSASAETERRVLAKAIAAHDAAERRRLLHGYFALRHSREAAAGAQAKRVEHDLERIEGTAKYIDCVGRATIAGGAARAEALLAEELRRPLAGQPGGYQVNWFRLRSYGTGAALTYLLSRLDHGNWRKRIEAGASPGDVLEAAVQRGAPPSAGLAESVKAEFGHSAITRELERAIRDEEKGEIHGAEAFLATAAYRLVLDATKETGNAGWAGTMVQLGPQTVALPKVQSFDYAAPSVSLTVRGLSVLMEGERYTMLLSAPPRIVGSGATAAGEHRLASLVVHADGLDLRIDRPVVVTVSEAATVIRLEPR